MKLRSVDKLIHDEVERKAILAVRENFAFAKILSDVQDHVYARIIDQPWRLTRRECNETTS